MKKIISLVLMGFILSGCSFFRLHKMDVEQGNVITQDMVSQLHPGMSETQVINVMGNPTLKNIFSPNRLDYIYTFQPGYGKRVEKRVVCIFYHSRLQQVISRV